MGQNLKVACLAVAGWTGLFAAAAARGEDWRQFRGPSGAGISNDAAAPMQWSEKKNLAWQTALPGPGSSSPIVVGQRVFVTCYSGYGTEPGPGDPSRLQRHLICLDRKDGEILWKADVSAAMPEDNYRGYLTEHGYASSTPVSDGESVFVFFGKSGVLAFDMAGKKLWQTNVGLESDIRRWGSASSPVLYKDTVIINASSESQSIRGLDKKTGKEAWKAEAASLSLAFGTPALLPLGSGQTELLLGVPGEVWGLNPDTGKLRWFAQVHLSGNVCPSVVAGGDGVAYLTGGFESRGTVAVRAGGKDDVSRTNLLWTCRESSYVPSPVLLKGKLYCVDDNARALCIDAATGTIDHMERLNLDGSRRNGKQVYASTLVVGEHLVAVTRRAGTLVLSADPQMRLLATNRIDGDDSDFNATPAVADGQLFLRSNKAVYCISSK